MPPSRRDYAREYQRRIANEQTRAAILDIPFSRSRARGHTKIHELPAKVLTRTLSIPPEERPRHYRRLQEERQLELQEYALELREEYGKTAREDIPNDLIKRLRSMGIKNPYAFIYGGSL